MATSIAMSARPDGKVHMCGAFLALIRFTLNSYVASVRRVSILIKWKQFNVRSVQRLIAPVLRRKGTLTSRGLTVRSCVVAAKAKDCRVTTLTASNILSNLLS